MTVVRKAHVKRCIGRTRTSDGSDSFEDNEEIWLDVYRIDELELNLRSDGQATLVTIKWQDADNSETDARDNNVYGENRELSIQKSTDPEEPPREGVAFLDPDTYVPVSLIDKIIIKDATQEYVYKFRNLNVTQDGGNQRIPTTRNIEVLRIPHHETSREPELNDATSYRRIVDADSYQVRPESKDDGQYIDMEVIKDYTFTVRSDYKDIRGDTLINQSIANHLKNLEVYEALGLIASELQSSGINSNGEDVIPARMDPFQSIVNVQWDKFYPKYGAAYGDEGDIASYVLFDVDKDGNLFIRFQESDPFGVSGWYLTTSDNVGIQDGRHSDPGEEVSLLVQSVLINWKGVTKLGGFAGLYEEGLYPAVLDFPPDVTVYNLFEYRDKDGAFSSQSVYEDMPTKGLNKGGFWVTSESVAAYDGDNQLWKLDGFILEILPGRKVLGYLEANENLYGVHTIDTNGNITDFLSIPVGDDSQIVLESSSNGDTYAIENDFGETSVFPRGSSVITRTNKNNEEIWRVEYGPTASETFTGPGNYQRQLAVIENHNKVFIMITDVDVESYGDHEETYSLPPKSDAYLVILDDSGTEVYREVWTTFIANYCAERGEAWCQISQVGTPRWIAGVISSYRFPQPPV